MSGLTEIQIIQGQLLRYMPLTTIVIGTIGNILNCLIFTRRKLSRNSCSIYFLSSSVANFFAIYFGCLPRLLDTFNIQPPASQLDLYCKIKTFLTYIGLASSAWFIVGACADRYASSAATVLLVFLDYFQMNFCFYGAIQAANCSTVSRFCGVWNDYNLLITFSLLPPALMFIFGWLTIRNVRTTGHLRRETNVKDRQLTTMLLIQVISTAILTLPISIQKLYSEITLNQTKSQESKLIENFFATYVVLLALMNTSTSFYLFTLTGKIFRKELKDLICSRQRHATIEPTIATTNAKK
ncbi:unnamed protein product [Adineta steineri]|uniref:G-protein coupled receptors family 1 profile domain-containing protein n=1 Tax=Adineta steineri TaxID=433720 RepID=A0A814I5U5_9BILA|nr:unnamed protein product [Adineta steineri]CAF1053869.1 unnamed protein product [Adineta steineri]CAF3557576.1 unnamed protein product [Adineta steineri]CAF4009286.1 unnamed protein product [Adineta steineri]